MGANSLPETVTRQRRGCDLNPGPYAPESSTLTTRLPSVDLAIGDIGRCVYTASSWSRCGPGNNDWTGAARPVWCVCGVMLISLSLAFLRESESDSQWLEGRRAVLL